MRSEVKFHYLACSKVKIHRVLAATQFIIFCPPFHVKDWTIKMYLQIILLFYGCAISWWAGNVSFIGKVRNANKMLAGKRKYIDRRFIGLYWSFIVIMSPWALETSVSIYQSATRFYVTQDSHVYISEVNLVLMNCIVPFTFTVDISRLETPVHMVRIYLMFDMQVIGRNIWPHISRGTAVCF